MLEKIHPYVLPLLDAIEDHVGATKTRDLMTMGYVEIIPLAYMRGRSLNDAFIILDEAQNTTPEQMKMFLTRLGYNSRMVITGDSSQSDLKIPSNGLQWASDRLRGTNEAISVVEFGSSNIVRNPLIESMLHSLDAAPSSRDRMPREGVGKLFGTGGSLLTRAAA